MMNLSTFKPLKNGIFPFPPLDGPPQRLEGTPERSERGEAAVYAGLVLERRGGLRKPAQLSPKLS